MCTLYLCLCLSLSLQTKFYKYWREKGSIYVNHPRIFHHKRETSIATPATRARNQKQNKTTHTHRAEPVTPTEMTAGKFEKAGEVDSEDGLQVEGKKKVNMKLVGENKGYREKTGENKFFLRQKDAENT